MTWNRQREQLTGADQLVSIICLFVYPIASLDQIAVLIYGNGGDMYIRPQIYERSRELELTRKRSSMESYDTFSPSSQRSLIWYKTLPSPLGVHILPVHSLIDIDKTGFYLKACASNYGHMHCTCRVRVPTHYRCMEAKVSVNLAVESGNPNIAPHLDGSL